MGRMQTLPVLECPWLRPFLGAAHMMPARGYSQSVAAHPQHHLRPPRAHV